MQGTAEREAGSSNCCWGCSYPFKGLHFSDSEFIGIIFDHWNSSANDSIDPCL